MKINPLGVEKSPGSQSTVHYNALSVIIMDKWNAFGMYLTLNNKTMINEYMISTLNHVKH